jgi:hypothetical protein
MAGRVDPQDVFIESNSPDPGVRVALIRVRATPAELMEIDHQVRLDL